MTIREEIEALNEGFSRDLANQDAEGLIARYADDALVVDVGEIIGPSGPSSKYVLVYRRQPDGSLRIAIDAANSLGAPPAE